MWVTGVQLHILLNKYITVRQITRPTVIYLFNYTEYSCLFLRLHLDSFNFRNHTIDKLLHKSIQAVTIGLASKHASPSTGMHVALTQ